MGADFWKWPCGKISPPFLSILLPFLPSSPPFRPTHPSLPPLSISRFLSLNLPLYGWLGFYSILSTQVAAISCLRKFSNLPSFLSLNPARGFGECWELVVVEWCHCRDLLWCLLAVFAQSSISQWERRSHAFQPIFTARCTLCAKYGIAIACRWSVRPSIHLSVCNVGARCSHRSENFQTYYTNN